MYIILARIIHVLVNCILFRPQQVTDTKKISARIGTQDNDIKCEHQWDCRTESIKTNRLAVLWVIL